MNRRSAATVADGAGLKTPTHPVSATHTLLIGVGSAVTFVLAFLFRFLSAEFANDHFMHLVEGRQVFAGEWPARDYFDFGLPLQVLTSTVTLIASGQNLYGEALVTITFIAAGVACTFAVSAYLSRSFTIAAAAATIAVLASPRLYNYPKAFFYVCAIWAAWHYARRPDLKRLIGLGCVVGIAFLYRHDHGVYIGLVSIILFVITHWGQPRVGATAFAKYSGVILLVIAPFLLFVQFTLGLPWYLSDLVPGAQASTAARLTWLPLSIDRSAPWITVDPPAERRFNVRWSDSLDPVTRGTLEAKYHLVNPRPEAPTTWSYATEDESRANIRLLVDDPAVVDTSGIDRAAGVLAVRELWYEWLQRRIPLLRMHILPGMFSHDNALPFFYYLTLAIPLAALVTLIASAWRGHISRVEGATAAMSVLMSLVAIVTLVRGSPDSRLADVTTIIAVTGAWLAARVCLGPASRSRRMRIALSLLVWILAVWSVGTRAHAGEALNATRILTGPAGVAWRLDEMRTRLGRRPIDTWTEEEAGYRGLTRYAFACTQQDDRFLVTWFEPMMYFYAEREFAGRHVFYDGGWHDSTRDQQATVERLQRQRVPIVFVRDDFELMFRKYFPIVAAYVDRNYAKSEPTANASQVAGYQVWVEKNRQPVRTYERLGLPCFR